MATSAIDKSALKNLEIPADAPVPNGRAWGPLVLEEKFPEALPLIELDMADEHPSKPTDELFLEKIWWVRGQLATEGMPLAALTTPLSGIFEGLKNIPRLNSIACSSYFLLARQLAEKKQTRLAVLFYEHALEFASSLSLKDRTSLRSLAAGVYRDELARAESKRESADYLAKLKSRAAELERVEKPKPEIDRKASSSSDDQKPTLSISAKSIRSAEFSQKSIRDEDELRTISDVVKKPSSPSQVKGFVLGVACVVLLLAAWDFGFKDRQSQPIIVASSSSPESEKPVSTPSPTATPMPAPNAQPISNNSGSEFKEVIEKAKAIDAKFDDLGERLKNVTFKGIDKQKSIEELVKDPEVDQAALKSKEATAAPKASASPTPGDDALASLDGTKTNPQIDPGKVPMLDPNKLGSAPPIEIAVPTGAKGTEPIEARDRNRDSIQPSLPQFGGPPDPKGRGMDGGPVRSYPVERLSEAEVYRTITETNVLSAPSLLAQTVTRLPSETSVQVVSRVGQWLELRSVGGKRGFIYAQDAVPSRDRP